MKVKNKKTKRKNYKSKFEYSNNENMNENENIYRENIRDLEKQIVNIILNVDDINKNIDISEESNILEDEILNNINNDIHDIKENQDNLYVKVIKSIQL